MPVRPRLAAQKPAEYAPAIRRFLETGEYPDTGTESWEVFDLSGDAERLHDAWLALRGGVLRAWAMRHPGTRPYGWWLCEAPRWQRADLPPRCASLGDVLVRALAEPRRRLGGRGTPLFEVLNVAPMFRTGIPVEWVTPFDQAYYNGRARDVRGEPIGSEYHEGDFAGVAPDPDDPPIFESEAAYLARHGLMSAAERRRLTPAAFEPEALNLAADAGGRP